MSNRNNDEHSIVPTYYFDVDIVFDDKTNAEQ